MRRKARELALQLLFQREFAPPISPQTLNSTIQEPSHSQDELDYATEIVNGVKDKQGEIDSLMQRYSQHWKVERMTTIDRNILRIGVFEMKFASSPLPAKVAINEAVELAKIYSTTDSPSFINGLLDQIYKA